jgi:hypothetical protein
MSMIGTLVRNSIMGSTMDESPYSDQVDLTMSWAISLPQVKLQKTIQKLKLVLDRIEIVP